MSAYDMPDRVRDMYEEMTKGAFPSLEWTQAEEDFQPQALQYIEMQRSATPAELVEHFHLRNKPHPRLGLVMLALVEEGKVNLTVTPDGTVTYYPAPDGG